jgi:hypothetical protein
VLQGEDGWLFLGADVSGACEPLLPLDETLAGLDRFGELVRRAGKTYVFTVAPDKSTMNPDKMPESYVGDDCAPEAKAAFWERMEDDPPVGYVDLKQELERVQEEDGENLWRPSDTHWAQRGGLVYAQQLADALDPALWRSSRIVPTGPVRLQADLAAQLGTPRTDEVPGLAARARGRHRHRGAGHDDRRHHDGRAAPHPAHDRPGRLVHAELAVAAVARCSRPPGSCSRRPPPTTRRRSCRRSCRRTPSSSRSSSARSWAVTSRSSTRRSSPRSSRRSHPPPPRAGPDRTRPDGGARMTRPDDVQHGVLVLSCSDAPGIVHAVSGLLLQERCTDRRELAVPQRHQRRPEQRHVLPARGVRGRDGEALDLPGCAGPSSRPRSGSA